MDKCCPICEEKLGLRDGRPWVHPESLSFDDFLGFFSSESTYMR
jgi:hypothetical protein